MATFRIPGSAPPAGLQVRIAAEQHSVMIEAVENHMPEVIVIDEIGTEAEAQALAHHRRARRPNSSEPPTVRRWRT